MTFLKPFEPQIYAALRIVAGFLMLWHGTQKLFGFPPSPMEPPDWIRFIAGPIELLGGVLVMIGLFTRPAAFVTSGQMAAAYFLGHALEGFQNGAFLPIQNRGELAAIYCFVFLFIASRGPGIWAVDRS
jgi:putative oxidoreductase